MSILRLLRTIPIASTIKIIPLDSRFTTALRRYTSDRRYMLSVLKKIQSKYHEAAPSRIITVEKCVQSKESLFIKIRPTEQNLDIPLMRHELKLRKAAELQKQKDAEEIQKTLCRQELYIHPPTPSPHPYLCASILAIGTSLALGTLCCYCIKYTADHREVNDKDILWPFHLEKRIKTTFSYYSNSMWLAACSGLLVLRSSNVKHFLNRFRYNAVGLGLLALVGTGTFLHSISYGGGCGAKKILYWTHFFLQGAVFAPICYLGGPVVFRILWTTFGALQGIATLALYAPSEWMFYKTYPIAAFLGGATAASLGQIILPKMTQFHSCLYHYHFYKFYGFLLLYTAYVLSDILRIVKNVNDHPLITNEEFDPINAMIIDYPKLTWLLFDLVTMIPRDMYNTVQRKVVGDEIMMEVNTEQSQNVNNVESTEQTENGEREKLHEKPKTKKKKRIPFNPICPPPPEE